MSKEMAYGEELSGMKKKGKRMLQGRFSANPRGFGFVVRETGEDLYVPAEETRGAMDGDTVQYKVNHSRTREDGRQEAIVTGIVEHAHQRVVGRFSALPSGGMVMPDARKLSDPVRIPADRTMDAREGQKVVVTITRWPDGVRAAEGEVLVVLGAETEPGVDVLSVLWQNAIPVTFSEAALAQAKELPEVPDAADFTGRRDLRGLPMVTIDGEDARDLDDAVSLERLPDGLLRLGVHIADVSHYVREGTPLDQDALERGTSVYLPDRVIPMLPEALSNGLCSLTARVPRLAFSVMMDVDASGVVVAHELFESVLLIDERMTYKAVRALLEDEVPELAQRHAAVLPMIRDLAELAKRRHALRKQRGSIDFAFDEAKIITDGDGHPIDIVRAVPNVATNLIEECMLLCNETVSEHFTKLKIPFVYRVHEDPDPDKMRTLREMLAHFGYRLPHPERVHPQDLQAILEKIKGKPEEKTIGTMMLRSLQKARYSQEHLWHFGLAAPYYSHFTSPIRRYPDLQIHRIMKETLHGNMDEKRQAHHRAHLPQTARHCSERERAADAAERECTDMKKAEYMHAHVGEVFDGTVSGVAAFGLFVELPNTVEGLVRLSALDDDYYEFDERSLTLVGERTHRVWRIGAAMKVLVAKASPEARQIDFIPAEGILGRQVLQAGPDGKTLLENSRMDDGKRGGAPGRAGGFGGFGGRSGKTGGGSGSGSRGASGTGKSGRTGKSGTAGTKHGKGGKKASFSGKKSGKSGKRNGRP